MNAFFVRTEKLLGKGAIEHLNKKTVAVFGLGGVGSYAVEALARCAVSNFIIVDGDTVDESNINRQLIATIDSIGKNKVNVTEERIKKINPKTNIEKHKIFYLPNQFDLNLNRCDYIIDAIDTISAKINIVEEAFKNNIPIISAMSAGNKLDPTKFEVADIYATSVCPICKIMRRELKKRNINKLDVVYSKEKPIKNDGEIGSISFVPPVMGMILASEVVKNLLKS